MALFVENYSLKKLNTFSLDVRARYYFSYSSEDELTEFQANSDFANTKKFILGNGSNVLFKNDFDGLILHPCIRKIEIKRENEKYADIIAGAGVIWDDLVIWCVENGYGGVENLSMIPGTVGASPVQNIGAYGVEVRDVILRVETYDYLNKIRQVFSNDDCMFDYRDSIFKNAHMKSCIIHYVVFRLDKFPVYQTHYGALKDELSKHQFTNLQTIRQSVINIRSSKLPDPLSLPNAGSFFKNPVINKNSAELLKEKYPDIPFYTLSPAKVKIAAGWLIEHSGWKGRREGNCGVHKDQALVLVNYGNATGTEILDLAQKIIDSVKNDFNITLEMEVNII